jgi:hypothetical protein
MKFSMPDRLVDEIAWAMRVAQFESLTRAGVPPTSISPLLWRDHNAKGLKRSADATFKSLASAAASATV